MKAGKESIGEAEIAVHRRELQQNRIYWDRKPILRECYHEFHEIMARGLGANRTGKVLEVGSGIPDFRTTIPGLIRSNLFLSEYVDRTEDVYDLSYSEAALDGIVMMDVFHHLEFPGNALSECHRVLKSTGRLVLFEPCISFLGRIIYGWLHAEPVGKKSSICWERPPDHPGQRGFYAAQGMASWVFHGNLFKEKWSKKWRSSKVCRYSAFKYLLSGGYSGPAFFSDSLRPSAYKIEQFMDRFPGIFATRLLVVLAKGSS